MPPAEFPRHNLQTPAKLPVSQQISCSKFTITCTIQRPSLPKKLSHITEHGIKGLGSTTNNSLLLSKRMGSLHINAR